MRILAEIQSIDRRDALRIVALALSYVLLHQLSLKISSVGNIGNLIWLPSGVAITGLLLYGKRLWPGIFTGSLLGGLLMGDPLTKSLVAAAGNTLDPLLATWLLTSVFAKFDARLPRQHDLSLLLLCGGLLGPLAGTIIGAPAYVFFSNTPPQEYVHAFIDWWMSAFIGVAMLAPLLLMLATRSRETFMILQRPWEAAALFVLAAFLDLAYWHQWGEALNDQTGTLVLIPCFLWAAIRLGQRGAALLAVLVYGIDLSQASQLPAASVAVGWNFWLAGVVMLLSSQFVAALFNEHKNMLKALGTSEERLRLSQKYGGIGTWEADLVTKQEFWSENCSQLLGFPALKAPTWGDFIAAVHPQDRSTVVDAVNAHIDHGGPFDIEYRIVAEDGQHRWMHSSGQSERGADGRPVRMRGIVEDVSKRVWLAQSLKASEHRYRALMQDARDAIVIADLDGNLEEINRAGELLLGYSRDEICRMRVPQIHPADELPKVRQHFEDIAKYGCIAPIETKILRKDGLTVDIEIRPTLVEIDGRTVAQGIFIDRTERVRQEQQRLAQEHAHRAALVREVHHRIKNNLQGITGILRQFAQKHPQLKEALEEAISQVNSIATVHGLLGRSNQTEVRLCELTIAIALGVESMWKKPVPIDIPPFWRPCRIAESEAVPVALVLNELISNAVKHGDADGLVSIAIRHEPRPNMVRLTIYNTGSLPPGFANGGQGDFGTGLQLTASLLPREGANLTWTQKDGIVTTTLELDSPIIYLEPFPLPNHE